MRPCTDAELLALLEKLVKFVGTKNAQALVQRPDDPHCFRVHRNRIYYVSETLMRVSTNVKRDDLLSLGTCFAKVTHSGSINLQITCLDHLAEKCLHKVWLKPSAEMAFLCRPGRDLAGRGRAGAAGGVAPTPRGGRVDAADGSRWRLGTVAATPRSGRGDAAE